MRGIIMINVIQVYDFHMHARVHRQFKEAAALAKDIKSLCSRKYMTRYGCN